MAKAKETVSGAPPIDPRPAWFVGAAYGGDDDQSERFLKEGIWQHGKGTKLASSVKAMQAGDRIALKSTYTRKKGLPFDNRGHSVSVLAIKAIGTITDNPADGRTVKVAWTRLAQPREWYFYTGIKTLWRVQPGHWKDDNLIAFAFSSQAQAMDKFRNDDLRKPRFGDVGLDQVNDKNASADRFNWIAFFEDVANKLAKFRSDRARLVGFVHDLSGRVEGVNHLTDTYADGSRGPLRDICPFTVMGLFNRGIKTANRRTIASELAKFLGVSTPIPGGFDGVPLLNNQNSWFFGYEKGRQADDIEALWDVFSCSLTVEDSYGDAQEWAKAYNRAIAVRGTAWNLTMGLFWIRPERFPTLDSRSRQYIRQHYEIEVPNRVCDADEYMSIRDEIDMALADEAELENADDAPTSYPELSFAAWSGDEPAEISIEDPTPSVGESKSATSLYRRILLQSRTHAVLLFGPAGTGKTFSAGEVADAYGTNGGRVMQVQFHPAYAYEDFMEGLRPEPTGDGISYAVRPGVFKKFCDDVRELPGEHLFIIDEINRGNVPKVMGELMYCLEYRDKQLRLPYSGDEFFIPENVHILGTMNSSDRSVALLDVALRRRFHFVELRPDARLLENVEVEGAPGIELDVLLTSLNTRIGREKGRHHLLGHSYLLPQDDAAGARRISLDDLKQRWFHQILPLLEEYFADDVKKLRVVIGPNWERDTSTDQYFSPLDSTMANADFAERLAKLQG